MAGIDQMWVDPPVDESIAVHACDFKKRRSDMDATPATLLTVLNRAHATAREWLSAASSQTL
jgi:hypothetical protein